jgi:hypothetical protein
VQDFELDPGGAGVLKLFEDLATKPCHANGIFGVEAPGRVRQDCIALRIDKIEQASLLRIVKSLTAHSDGHDFATASLKTFAHEFIGRILAGPDKEAGAEALFSDSKWLGVHPRISSR